MDSIDSIFQLESIFRGQSMEKTEPTPCHFVPLRYNPIMGLSHGLLYRQGYGG